jgi:lysophospholipase L1-like esterase
MSRRLLLVLIAVVAVVIAIRLLAPQRVTNREPTGTTIVCFGDSLTEGVGAEAGESYPDQLERRIGRPVVNAGVSGDTTGSALARLDSDVLARDPRIVLITLGGNDLMQGVPPEEALANLERIVESIHGRGALVVVGGVSLSLVDRGYGGVYEELRERTGCLVIGNVLDDIIGRPALMSDRIHPNGKGYAVMAERFHDVVEPYL